MSTAGGRVFFSGANGVVYALDESTGGLVWSQSGALTPIVADGLVFAVSRGEVVAIGSPIHGLRPTGQTLPERACSAPGR